MAKVVHSYGRNQSRIEQEPQTLKSEGDSHKSIHEKQFGNEMIYPVVLIESESNTDVIITNEPGKTLDSSAPFIILRSI